MHVYAIIYIHTMYIYIYISDVINWLGHGRKTYVILIWYVCALMLLTAAEARKRRLFARPCTANCLHVPNPARPILRVIPVQKVLSPPSVVGVNGHHVSTLQIGV